MHIVTIKPHKTIAMTPVTLAAATAKVSLNTMLVLNFLSPKGNVCHKSEPYQLSFSMF